MDNLINCLKARAKCIWLKTYEEDSVIHDIVEAVAYNYSNPLPIYLYNFALGAKKIEYQEQSERKYKSASIDSMLKIIFDLTRNIRMSDREIAQRIDNDMIAITTKKNIFLLQDFHLILENPNIITTLKTIFGLDYVKYNPIIIIDPIVNIPMELEPFITVIDYTVPNEEIIGEIINKIIENGIQKSYVNIVDKDEIPKIIKAAKGLTENEIIYAFHYSIKKNEKIISDEIFNFKLEKIKKLDILDYSNPKITFNDIGGNKAFKKWIDEIIEYSNSNNDLFIATKPKGYLALGVPGCGKTIIAEAIANKLNVPFIKLNMAKVLNSRVGESEKNIAKAFDMINANAPCVLLIDEIEKSLSGIASSNASDAGTMARIIGTILTGLNENDKGIFTIMTSNDVSQLPPELTRVGRLDGIWYFSYPNEEERFEIVKIHFSKVYKNNISKDVIRYAVEKTENFTGSEIEQLVKICCRKAYIRYMKDNNSNIIKCDIDNAAKEIVPIFKSSKEQMYILENFAKGRARFANEDINDVEEVKTTKIKNVLTIKDL